MRIFIVSLKAFKVNLKVFFLWQISRRVYSQCNDSCLSQTIMCVGGVGVTPES